MRSKFLKMSLLSGMFLLLLANPGNAQEPYFGKNKVQYETFDWYFIRTGNFDIYFYQDEYHLAKFAADVLEDAYVKVREELRYDLRGRVPVIIYNSHSDFQQTNVIPYLIEEGVGGFTEVFKNRIVVPFTGSYEDYRHVLHHELTHAVTFDMLYGNMAGSLLSQQYLFQLPLWFAEGYAEYSSRGGWDIQADMILRDATVNGYLAPLDLAGGYLVYKEGQSAIGYIVNKYGEEKLSEILEKGKTSLSMDKALKSAIGLDTKGLSEEWAKYLRKEYWPEIASRSEPKDFAKQLTDHTKDGSYMNERPAFSPQGDRLAIFSDRSDYTEVYIISAIDGKVIERLVKGERSGDLESLHSYVSGLSWSPDGRSLAFVSKSKGKDVLSLIDVRKKKIYKRLRFNLDAMRSPSWSPDTGKIVFVGIENGKTDIYSCDLETEQARRLTDDYYDDEDPSFSPDGKFIAFSSDRPISSFEDSASHEYGHYNLHLYDLESHQTTPLTENQGNNASPTWSPDGRKLCFVSDRNGTYNLYVLDLDSSVTFPISNVLSGCFSPSWSKDGEKIAFSAFQKGGWNIFLLKEIKPVSPEGGALAKTPYLLALEADTISIESDTAESEGLSFAEEEETVEEKPDFTSYVFKAGQSELDSLDDVLEEKAVEKKDTLSTKLPSGEYAKKKYKLKFSPDLVSGGLSYDTYYGLSGQSFISISDMFGNHTFLLATDLVNTIDQSNFQLFYLYMPKRINYGAGILHTKYYYIDSYDRLFSDRVYGALGYMSIPFSKFTRADVDLTQISVDRVYYDPPYDDRSVKVLLASLSLINDTVIWGHTGPVNGSRSLFSYEYAPYVTPRYLSYGAAIVDYRKYWHFKKRYSFTFRSTGGFSHGEDKKKFYLGGISNWIGPSLGSEEIYGINDLYFGNVITPLRGYKYFDVEGSKFFLTNIEFRYPFVEHLVMKFPLPFSIHYVNGALFYDMGAAWDENSKFKGGTSEGGSRLKDIKAGFGFGARANLGFFVLRYDAAWSTDFDSVSPKPRHYLSLGAEF
jgi:dipeptidyl aminopeptidase/acylaminoacyl peptidase